MITDRESGGTQESNFEALLQQHREYEQRLEELTNKPWLTPEEELEEKRIKKLKLRIKDQIARLGGSTS